MMFWQHIFLLLDLAGLLGALVLMWAFRTRDGMLRPLFVFKIILMLVFLWLLAGDILTIAESSYAFIAREPVRPLVFRTPLVCGLWYMVWKIHEAP